MADVIALHQFAGSGARRRAGCRTPVSMSLKGSVVLGRPAQQESRNVFCRNAQVLPILAAGMLAGNRVINKMVMVPMEEHVLFLALFQTALYVLVYSGVLLTRRMAGAVTEDMLKLAQSMLPTFLLIGLAEAIQLVMFYTATAKLPGVVLPVLSQSALVWNFLLSAVILRKGFSSQQLAGALLVGFGAAMVASDGAAADKSVSFVFAGIYILSMLFPAIAAIMKERIFIVAREKFNGENLDVFVVNTFGSLAQVMALVLLFPLILAQRGIAMADFSGHMLGGFAAFTGTTAEGWVKLLPALGLVWNVAFNIIVLAAVRSVGAANVVVALTASVPLAIYTFTLPLPVIGAAPLPGKLFLPGAVMLMLGMLTYHWISVKTVLFGPPPGTLPARAGA